MKNIFAISGMINYSLVVFLNAFTDLGHKIIIQNTIFKVYDGDLQIILTTIVNALILLPFLLVFSPSGFLADRFAKNKIMQHSALFAIFITLLITLSYYQGWFIFAFVMTFLLALQSAIYGPAKYGYIKELFTDRYLTAGNGITQAVTTVAILSGIIVYTVLFENTLNNHFITKEDVLMTIAPLGWLLVVGSIIEWFLASKLPNKVIHTSRKHFDFKKYFSGVYLFRNLKMVTRKKEIFKAIIAISIFWSISQVVLAIFGEYAKSELGVINTIFVQGVMALAGVGIVIGSILCAKFSKYYVNVGLSTIGAIGVTVIVFLIPFVHNMSLIAIMFTLFGVFAGFLLVSLNAYIQDISPSVHLGTILAGNNFIQNIFMFSFLMLTTLFVYFGMNAEILFYLMGFVGLYLIVLLYKTYTVMSIWSLFEIITTFFFKFNYIGLENIPKDKAVLFLGNHVSWIDWIILQLPFKRRINFMIDKDIYHKKLLNHTLKKGKLIPLSTKASKDAFCEASIRLKRKNIVTIFPEGQITNDATLGKFHRGYELIDKDYEGVIIPFFIDGMFGSIFAKNKTPNRKKFLRRREVNLYFSSPISKDISANELEIIVQKMKAKYEFK